MSKCDRDRKTIKLNEFESAFEVKLIGCEGGGKLNECLKIVLIFAECWLIEIYSFCDDFSNVFLHILCLFLHLLINIIESIYINTVPNIINLNLFVFTCLIFQKNF